MNENVKVFFEKYNSDPELRERIRIAEENYPGSLEIREALAENVLLPEAENLGLGFTIDELRSYEEDLWEKSHSDEELSEEELSEWDPAESYWLLGRGWSNDEGRFCGDK
jgi:hypothetical protein